MNRLKLSDSGAGGLKDLMGKLNPRRALYGMCRVGRNQSLIVMILWVGNEVDEHRRAECASHLPAIRAFFREVQIFLPAHSLDEITEERMCALASKAAMVMQMQRQRPGLRQEERQETVGTNYKRTIAAAEILRGKRESFWAKAEREEDERKKEEQKRAAEERRKREIERVHQERREAMERERRMMEREQKIKEQRRIQAQIEAEERRQEKIKWKLQEREREEEEARARYSRSESEEKASEAAALVSQRTTNPREFFRQLSSSSSVNSESQPSSPYPIRSPFGRRHQSQIENVFSFNEPSSFSPPSTYRSIVASPYLPSTPTSKSPTLLIPNNATSLLQSLTMASPTVSKQNSPEDCAMVSSRSQIYSSSPSSNDAKPPSILQSQLSPSATAKESEIKSPFSAILDSLVFYPPVPTKEELRLENQGFDEEPKPFRDLFSQSTSDSSVCPSDTLTSSPQPSPDLLVPSCLPVPQPPSRPLPALPITLQTFKDMDTERVFPAPTSVICTVEEEEIEEEIDGKRVKEEWIHEEPATKMGDEENVVGEEASGGEMREGREEMKSGLDKPDIRGKKKQHDWNTMEVTKSEYIQDIKNTEEYETENIQHEEIMKTCEIDIDSESDKYSNEKITEESGNEKQPDNVEDHERNMEKSKSHNYPEEKTENVKDQEKKIEAESDKYQEEKTEQKSDCVKDLDFTVMEYSESNKYQESESEKYQEKTMTEESESEKYQEKTMTEESESEKYQEKTMTEASESEKHQEETITEESESEKHQEERMTEESESEKYQEETITEESESEKHQEKTMTEDSDSEKYQEERMTEESESEKYQEKTMTEDSESEKYQEKTMTEESESEKYQEKTMTEESESEKYQEKTMTEESESEKYQEKTMTEDSESEKYQEKTMTEESESEKYQEKTMTEESESEKYQEKTMTEESESEKHQEKTMTEDSESEKYQEKTMTEESESEKYQEKTMTEESESEKYQEKTMTEESESEKHQEETITEESESEKYQEERMTEESESEKYKDEKNEVESERVNDKGEKMTEESESKIYKEETIIPKSEIKAFKDENNEEETDIEKYQEEKITEKSDCEKYEDDKNEEELESVKTQIEKTKEEFKGKKYQDLQTVEDSLKAHEQKCNANSDRDVVRKDKEEEFQEEHDETLKNHHEESCRDFNRTQNLFALKEESKAEIEPNLDTTNEEGLEKISNTLREKKERNPPFIKTNETVEDAQLFPQSSAPGPDQFSCLTESKSNDHEREPQIISTVQVNSDLSSLSRREVLAAVSLPSISFSYHTPVPESQANFRRSDGEEEPFLKDQVNQRSHQ